MSSTKKSTNYTLNVAIAMVMLSMWGDDIKIDENEQQGLITLTNPDDDCYCTITKVQYGNLFTQLANTIGDDDKETAEFNQMMGDEELGEMPTLVTEAPTNTLGDLSQLEMANKTAVE